jgi:hypothetical protein
MHMPRPIGVFGSSLEENLSNKGRHDAGATQLHVAANPNAVQNISFTLPYNHHFNKSLHSSLINLTRDTYQPWPESEKCQKYSNHFAKLGTFNPVAILASFPGSGNTWVRYLIEGATGFFTRGPDLIVSILSWTNPRKA